MGLAARYTMATLLAFNVPPLMARRTTLKVTQRDSEGATSASESTATLADPELFEDLGAICEAMEGPTREGQMSAEAERGMGFLGGSSSPMSLWNLLASSGGMQAGASSLSAYDLANGFGHIMRPSGKNKKGKDKDKKKDKKGKGHGSHGGNSAALLPIIMCAVRSATQGVPPSIPPQYPGQPPAQGPNMDRDKFSLFMRALKPCLGLGGGSGMGGMGGMGGMQGGMGGHYPPYPQQGAFPHYPHPGMAYPQPGAPYPQMQGGMYPPPGGAYPGAVGPGFGGAGMAYPQPGYAPGYRNEWEEMGKDGKKKDKDDKKDKDKKKK